VQLQLFRHRNPHTGVHISVAIREAIKVRPARNEAMQQTRTEQVGAGLHCGS
jgi:hypothetical protein